MVATFRVTGNAKWLPKEPHYSYSDIPKDIIIHGDLSFRGKCPHEDVEARAFVAMARRMHPEYARGLVHIPNEYTVGKSGYEITKAKREGMTPGHPDFIFGGRRFTGYVELKRKDPTQSTWNRKQTEFMLDARKNGAWVAYALGADGALLAFERWMEWSNKLDKFFQENCYGARQRKEPSLAHEPGQFRDRLRDGMEL